MPVTKLFTPEQAFKAGSQDTVAAMAAADGAVAAHAIETTERQNFFLEELSLRYAERVTRGELERPA